MKNILIIEDSKLINNIIKRELSALGFSVAQAFTLSAAKEHLSRQKFQLIILDLHLPDGEGSELIANIQSLTKTKVVVLTSSQEASLREELFEYGILDYIVKDNHLIYSIAEIIKIIHTITTKTQDRILVIDDSRFICKQIKTILEPRNYKITISLTGKTALERLKKSAYELIILDMELPDIHGLELLEIIRKDNKFLHVPILVLSGTSTPDIIRDVLKNGANDFLKKPFVFEEFILKVDFWIDYFKKERELKEKTQELKKLNENLKDLVQEEVEKNRLKDKLMFTQSRQAQMGEMISMIAHQWRQPLNAISAATTVIELKAQMAKLDAQEAKKITTKIQDYTQYLSHTIDDFRDFFKPQKEKKVTDFQSIVQKALTLTQNVLEQKHILLEQKVQDLTSFSGYENELIQVVLNIINNARDALLSQHIKQPKISIFIEANKLTITDNAGGIPSNIIKKIFDPYFSTKENKNGTGLGLYMSKIIVQDHCGGTLKVQNSNNGAMFSIEIPLSQEENANEK
ncbi:response regulator [Sulfurimonas sp.]